MAISVTDVKKCIFFLFQYLSSPDLSECEFYRLSKIWNFLAPFTDCNERSNSYEVWNIQFMKISYYAFSQAEKLKLTTQQNILKKGIYDRR